MDLLMATDWDPKDPTDTADYTFNWGDPDPDDASLKPFLPAGETITASTVNVPVGLTKIVADNTTTTARVRISGGIAGVDYPITNAITTSAGETFEITKTLPVRDRTK